MNSSRIPSFCIVGQANQGKTTLLATLTENDRLDISNMPGTTTAATEYPVEVSDEKIITFWDTPGFENSSGVQAWFQEHAEKSENPARDFIDTFRDKNEFRAECEIFRPISKKAVVIFIVDSSQRVRDTDKQQVDILRQCGNPRIAVIYSKDGKARHHDEWTRLLSRDFNIRVPFNAHKAGVSERFLLLDKIKTMFPEWEEKMDKAIKALKKEHERKRSEAIGHLISMLRNILNRRKSMELDESRGHEEIRKDLEEKIRNAVRTEERQFRDKTRRAFGHSEEHWKMDELLTDDIFSNNVWKVLGLTITQLVIVSAAVGAIAGAIIDAHLGGASFMLGTAIGGVIGGGMGYMSAERVAMVSLPKASLLPRIFRGKKLGGAQAIAKVDPKSAIFGILIDRGMLYLEQVIDRPHGLDDNTPTKISAAPSAVPQADKTTSSKGKDSKTVYVVELPSEPKRSGLSGTWSMSDHKILGTFLGLSAKDSPDAIKLDEAKANLKRVMIKQFQILTPSAAESRQLHSDNRSITDQNDE